MSYAITYGLHAVRALLKMRPQNIHRLLLQQDKHDKQIDLLIQCAKEAQVTLQLVAKSTLDQLTADGKHQGVVAEHSKTPLYSEADLDKLIEYAGNEAFFLILDGVQDPHNLGASLRSADAFGVHAVIIPKDKSVGLTPAVSKVASGAMESVPVLQVTNLARVITKLKESGCWVYGAADTAATSLYHASLQGPLAIVLGAEGSGLRRLTRDLCDGLLSIPMLGIVSSLNVSVATGIFLFEVTRQRQSE
jgi:23S rRNA (guanosine2251-2'-O)-methyltransferase